MRTPSAPSRWRLAHPLQLSLLEPLPPILAICSVVASRVPMPNRARGPPAGDARSTQCATAIAIHDGPALQTSCTKFPRAESSWLAAGSY